MSRGRPLDISEGDALEVFVLGSSGAEGDGREGGGEGPGGEVGMFEGR